MDPLPEELEISSLIQRARAGDREAEQRLAEAAEPLLRRLAGQHLRQQPDSLLESSALLNEAWLRLCAKGIPDFNGRRHFMAAASRTMRTILVDRVKQRLALKRGGGSSKVGLEETPEPSTDGRDDAEDLLSLDELLREMNSDDAHLVEYRLFGGLSCREVADIKGLSTRTVERHWQGLAAQLKSKLGR